MAIIKQLNKRTGITYIYESHSYRDPVTKQPRSKRRCIGKLDMSTNQIIPTRKKRVTTNQEESDTTSMNEPAMELDIIKEKDAEIVELRRRINDMERKIEKIHSALDSLVALF